MKKILIIGATSAIAEHCARLWAARGEQLFLIARNEERLNTITADLRVRGCGKAESYCMDANDLAHHPIMLDKAEAALGNIDTVLIAHGTLANQTLC